MIKNIVLSSLMFSLVVLAFTSCRKYEEGPNVSFRTKTARVTNDWRVESAEVNGIEASSDPYWAKQKHQFYSNKKYIQTIIDPVTLEARTINGTWLLYDNDRKIAITTKDAFTNKDSTVDWNILKLFNKQFWVRKTDNTVELHFVPFN